MATYMRSDVSSSGSDNEHDIDDAHYTNDNDASFYDNSDAQPTVLPLELFYKKVLSDLLVCRNDSFFNYCFSEIFSRKLQANINGKTVGFNELRAHFASLRRAYAASVGHSASSSSSSASSSSSSNVNSSSHHHHHHTASSASLSYGHAGKGGSLESPFAPDGSVLKFGPFLANSTNGGREGYLAAHTVLANLIHAKWESSPLLLSSNAGKSSPSPSYARSEASTSSGTSSSSSSPNTSPYPSPSAESENSAFSYASGGEDEQGQMEGDGDADADADGDNEADTSSDVLDSSSPRKRKARSQLTCSHLQAHSFSSSELDEPHHPHHHAAMPLSHQQPRRIKYNTLVVSDTMEIQWMEGKDGECRKITRFDRTVRRPVARGNTTAAPMGAPAGMGNKASRVR